MSAWVRKSGRTAAYMSTSGNGNPRYRVTFADGTTFTTEPDAQVNYGITNSDYDGDVEIELNGAGRIVGIRAVS